MNKVALVTGAGGFIGSHLVERLIEKEYHVKAMTWYNPMGRKGWLDTLNREPHSRLEIIPGDIRDSHQVNSIVAGVSHIFHLAALITIPYSYQAPESYVQTNIGGTLNLLQACRANPVSRILIVSSSEVYGTAQFTPITESHPLQAQSPYSASKIAKEKLAESFFHSYQLPISIVRPFNTYGPRQSLRGVIPSIILQLLNGDEKVLIGDSRPTRDWVYVCDTVNALVDIAEQDTTIGKVLNIATGVETTVGSLAETLLQKILPSASLTQDPQRMRPTTSEVFRLCGSSELLHSLTQWEPKFTLDKGLEETILWFEKHRNLDSYQNLSYRI
ncbi:MAG: SDR family NAD(P)-dependent oxidoreductase [Bacteroidota bacterium]